MIYTKISIVFSNKTRYCVLNGLVEQICNERKFANSSWSTWVWASFSFILFFQDCWSRDCWRAQHAESVSPRGRICYVTWWFIQEKGLFLAPFVENSSDKRAPWGHICSAFTTLLHWVHIAKWNSVVISNVYYLYSKKNSTNIRYKCVAQNK